MPWKVEFKMVSVDFIPRWTEVDDKGKPTGRFKSVIGERMIKFEDLPSNLQTQLTEFVRRVLEDE